MPLINRPTPNPSDPGKFQRPSLTPGAPGGFAPGGGTRNPVDPGDLRPGGGAAPTPDNPGTFPASGGTPNPVDPGGFNRPDDYWDLTLGGETLTLDGGDITLGNPRLV